MNSLSYSSYYSLYSFRTFWNRSVKFPKIIVQFIKKIGRLETVSTVSRKNCHVSIHFCIVLVKHLCLLIIWILYFIYSVFFPKTCKFKVFKLLKKFQRKICYSDLTFIYKAGKYREIQGSTGEFRGAGRE